MDLMFATNFFTNLACNSNECLSWLIIVLNIVTVAYLVFCAFFRFTKFLKVIGFIWIILVLGGIVAVLVYHTCIFTIVCAAFTLLVLVATFAMILKNQKQTETQSKTNETKKKGYGAYVINPTNDGKYTFAFYNKHKKLVLESGYTLGSIEQINEAINVCRMRGEIAKFEDHTSAMISEKGFPKFELHEDENGYYYLFRCNSQTEILRSQNFKKHKNCLKELKCMMKIVKSSKVYYSTDVVINTNLVDLKSKYLNTVNN